METQQLKENIISLLKDIQSVRPKRDGRFITRVLIKCHPSPEQLKIDPFLFVAENATFKRDSKSEVEETEEGDDEKQTAVN